MRTEAYKAAKKEFINCIAVSPFCLFFSLINAFGIWMPIMQAEKKKAA